MPTNTDKVYTPAPGVKGVVFAAPYSKENAQKGIDLAKDFTKDLNGLTLAGTSVLVNLGGLSDAGIVNAEARDHQKVKDFSGSVISTPQSDFSSTFKLDFVESTNLDVLRLVYGVENVKPITKGGTGADANTVVAVQVNHTAAPLANWVFVTETIQGSKLRRQVIPKGQPITVGDVTQVSKDIIRYEVTVEAFGFTIADGSTVHVVEYLSPDV
ncbi:hypothetical protein D5S18_02985 [Nocardia panacis]|uniref:Phage tail protein n=1 Tax=Nocardia panacis TaxID=2340916 RepID=A0A3A4L8D3_9NOCA|nr:hypothetical protein [Nocardia panacis]RJO79311.1 hypothetical protein D5S18_02985 [Nocardia panacis]